MLIDFLRARICDGKIDEQIKEEITEENLEKLYTLSKKHDVDQIVADVLFEQKLVCEGKIAEQFKVSLMRSIVHYQRLSHEVKKICTLFNDNEICHILLKGSVLRAFYPEPWLRTSCDADILIKKEDIERAKNLLAEKLNYTLENKSSHDWSFIAPNKVNIELHFDLIEQGNLTKSELRHKWNSDYLNDVWKNCIKSENKQFEYEMTHEMFYFYHVAHMAKHFENGGCGVRSVLDLWVLNNNFEYDKDLVKNILSASGLIKFESIVKELSELWFSEKTPDNILKIIEDYILDGGIYGNAENNAAVGHNKKGGNVKYIYSRIFLPYEYLKVQYPVLNKHKWLLPLCEILRWLRLFCFKNWKRSIGEFNVNQNLSSQKVDDVSNMLDMLGL